MPRTSIPPVPRSFQDPDSRSGRFIRLFLKTLPLFTEEELRYLHAVIRRQLRATVRKAGQEAAWTFQHGDLVTIGNGIRPRYWEGAQGRVIGIQEPSRAGGAHYVQVSLIDHVVGGRGRNKLVAQGTIVRIPPLCLTKSEV